MVQTNDDVDWLNARLTATEALIVAVEAAILALSSGAQSYTLDSGQTRQTVTKADIASLRNQITMLDQRRDELRSRLGFTATLGHQVRVVPRF